MGTQRTFTVGDAPEIVVEEVGGDLRVRGWGRGEVWIESDDDRLEVSQQEDAIRIRCYDDCNIQAPHGARLRVQGASDDVEIVSIRGEVTVGSVGDDLDVRDCGPLAVSSVGGDFAARVVQGDCRVGSVGGDATITRVDGNLSVEQVGDDLTVTDVRGNVRARAGDDVALRLMIAPGGTYDIEAGDDLTCRIQADASATVSLNCGDDIQLRRLSVPDARMKQSASFVLGAGEAKVALRAGSDIVLSGLTFEELGDLLTEMGVNFGADFSVRASEFGQQLAAQIESQVGAVARQIDEKFAQFGSGEEFAARLQERVSAALRKAEEKMNETLRNAEARAKEAEKRAADAERQRGRPGAAWQAPLPPKPPKPPKPPVSEEERMMVLRMVSEGKLSVEQAEKLLAALNGESGLR